MSTDRLLLDALYDNARVRPTALALSSGSTEIDYGHLVQLVDDGAARLAAAGVGGGDRVMLVGENSLTWIVAFLATLRLGAVVVPVNTRLGGDQLPQLVENIDPALVLIDEHVPAPPSTVLDRWPVRSLGDGSMLRLVDLPEPAEIRPIRSPSEPSAAALIAFTSGTTSTPKGAIISHGALAASVRAWLGLTGADDRWSTTILVPLFHNTAYVDQLAQMLICGGAIDVPGRYRTDDAVSAMVDRPPTLLVMVPAMAAMITAHPHVDQAFAGCRILGVGGAALPATLGRDMARRWPGMEVWHGYGLTEFTSLSHALSPAMLAEVPDSVGRPVDGVECSIRDPEGRVLAAGRIGEVWLRGPMVMDGYWNNPDATAAVLVDGWLRTGDRGRVDPTGRLWLHGRIQTVINRGGEKISPEIVESVIGSIPSVGQACVVGIADDILGQTVAAAVVPIPGEEFDPALARRLVGQRLPDYAWPDPILVVDRMPLAATGKIDRERVAELVLDWTTEK